MAERQAKDRQAQARSIRGPGSQARPTIFRDSVRIAVVNDAGELLLLHTRDPVGGLEWWELPGGGIEEDEPASDAARRELYEETGITIEAIGPLLGIVNGEFDFNGRHYRQREQVFAARVNSRDCRPGGLGSVERTAILDHRWWRPEDIAAAELRLYPTQLLQLLPRLGQA
jgi:8-oxo-dGTP pyrophosphatase MutT (NUDIX family)